MRVNRNIKIMWNRHKSASVRRKGQFFSSLSVSVLNLLEKQRNFTITLKMLQNGAKCYRNSGFLRWMDSRHSQSNLSSRTQASHSKRVRITQTPHTHEPRPVHPKPLRRVRPATIPPADRPDRHFITGGEGGNPHELSRTQRSVVRNPKSAQFCF